MTIASVIITSALPTTAIKGQHRIVTSNGLMHAWNGTTWVQYGAGGGGAAISASGSSVSSGTVVFSNSNGVSFGMSGGTITATVTPGAAAGIGALGASSQTATIGTVVLSASNGLSFGMSGSSRITGSHDGFRSASAGTTYALGPGISFGNANNVTFGANGSTITASASYSQSTSPAAIAAGLQTATAGTVAFVNSNGITFGMSGSSRVTASYTVPSTAGLISAINLSAGTTSTNATAFTFSNSNGVSFGLNGQTVTGSVAAGATATGNLGAIGAGTQTATSGSVAFANSNGLTFGMSGSSQITGSYTVPSTAGLISAVNLSAGTTSQNLTAMVFSNGGNVTFGLNGSTVTASAPAGGGGAATTLSSWEPYPLVANTGTASLSLSSNTSAAMMLFPFNLPAPVAAEALGIIVSMSFLTGGGSSFRQSGSLSYGLYTRPTGTNSTQLSLAGGNLMSYALTYNASTITIHQPTSTGSNAYTTGSTTSAGLNISSGYTGLKLINLPVGSTLTPGHYWLGIHHRNSSSSFNSGIRLSLYGAAWTLTGLAPMGSFSSAYSTGTNVPLGLGGNLLLGQGSYSLAALTSLPSTITMSQISQAGVNLIPYMLLSTRV